MKKGKQKASLFFELLLLIKTFLDLVIFAKVKGIITIFLFVLTYTAIGQNSHEPKKFKFNPEVNFKSAFLLPHSGAIKSLMNGTMGIYEVGAEFPSIGNKALHDNFPLHNWGIMLNFSPLTNQEVLGFGAGILPYLNVNILRHKNSNWNFRLASGLGFIQKPFNNIKNPKNMVIGSYFNNTTDFSLQYNTQLTAQLNTKFGFGLQHFSNGAFIRPNLGLNLPYASISIQRAPAKQKNLKVEKDSTNESSGFYVKSLYGSKTLALSATERYDVVQLTGGYSFGFKRGKLLHLQLDVIYDESTPYLKIYEETLGSFGKWILGSFLTYEKKYGQIGVFIGSGLYFHSPYNTFDQDWSYANKGGNFYNRIGCKYYLNNHLNIQLSIRSHTGEADNGEIGIGYKF